MRQIALPKEGAPLIITVLLIACAVAGARIGYDKYLSVQAAKPKIVYVRNLTLEQIVEAGTKASGTVVQRLLSRVTGGPQATQDAEGNVRWEIPSRGSSLTFQVAPLEEGKGYRVIGTVDRIRISQIRDRDTREWKEANGWTRSKRVSNWVYASLGILHKPQRIIRLRNRVLRAVAG